MLTWTRIQFGAQLLLPGLVLAAVWGDRISATVFGADYALGVKVFVVLAVGLIAQIAAGPNGFVLMAARRHGELARIGGGIVILNLALNLALVPTVGVLGAASASTASFIVLNVAYGLAMQREVGAIRWNNRVVSWELCYLAVLVVAVAAPRFVFGPDAIAFACSALLALAVFGGSSRSETVRPVMVAFVTSFRRPNDSTRDSAVARPDVQPS